MKIILEILVTITAMISTVMLISWGFFQQYGSSAVAAALIFGLFCGFIIGTSYQERFGKGKVK